MTKTKSSAKKIAKKPIAKKAKRKEPLEPTVTEETAAPKANAGGQEARVSNSESFTGRDRRMNPEGRRGRFAEKTPPGTRTKMIKIIYDRKAELQEQRKKLRIIKLTFLVIIMGCLYYGGISLVNFAKQTGRTAIETLNIDDWWESISKPQRKTQTTSSMTKSYTKRQKIKSSKKVTHSPRNSKVIKKSKPKPKKRTYKRRSSKKTRK